MNTPLRLLHGWTAALTDVAALALLMETVSLGGSRGRCQPDVILWLALTLIVVLVNLLLFRRGVPAPALAAVDGGLYALTLFLLLRFSPLVEGPFGYLMAVCFPAISCGRAVYHAWHAPALQVQLTRLDGALACGAWALLLWEGGSVAAPLLWLIPALLALNAVCAISLRVGGGEDAPALLVGAPVGGALFSGALAAALAALVLGPTWLLGGGSRAAVAAFFQGVRALLLILWRGIEAFFGWLVRLFPQDVAEVTLPPPPPAAALPEADPAGASMAGLLPVCAALLGAGVAVVLVLVLLRLRRTRLRAAPLLSRPAGGAMVRVRTHGLLRRRWNALLAELRFRLRAARYAATPAGLLVRLERWGRQHKVPRGPGEPVRAYLLRLEPGGTLDPLADALDAQFYGPGGPTLNKARCRALRRAFLQAKRAAG